MENFHEIIAGIHQGYKMYREALRQVYNERQVNTIERATIVNILFTIYVLYKVVTAGSLKGAAKAYRNGTINSIFIGAFYGVLLRLQKDKV